MQNMLREKAGVKLPNLADELQQVLEERRLPSHTVAAIDGVRNIGNFAAHPIRSKRTEEVLLIKAGEAEWDLDVSEALYDVYFVQLAKLQQRKDAL